MKGRSVKTICPPVNTVSQNSKLEIHIPTLGVIFPNKNSKQTVLYVGTSRYA